MRKHESVTRHLAAAIILIMSLSLVVPALGAPPDGSGTQKKPEPPEGAQTFNRTEVTPVAYMHEYLRGAPQVLRFMNMTMQLNCSRNMVMNITASPGLKLRYFDLNLEADRPLMLRAGFDVEPPSETPGPQDGLGRFITIEPNATAQIRATLRLFIDEEGLEEELGRNIWIERLRWAYWNGIDWEPVESWMDAEGFLVAETDHFSTWTVRQAGPPEVPTPDMPGVPSHTRAYNYTDVTPERFTWSLREREGTLLMFRNTAMMLNCSRNLDLDITVGPEVEHRMFSLQLNPTEPMRLRIQMETNAPPGIKPPQRVIGLYVGIEPNATTPVNARMGLEIDREAIQARLGREINATALRWAFWNGVAWEEVESELDENGVLHAETEHFSTWTIVERRGRDIPTPDIPGVPAQTRAYNYTDVTPEGFKWSLQKREGTLLMFRNMAMLFNCTEELDLDITSDPEVEQHMFALQMGPGEPVQLRLRFKAGPPEEVSPAQKGLGLYVDIEPNVTGPVNARLGLYIDEELLNDRLGRNIFRERLRWAYWNGTDWEPVESDIDEDDLLQAETTHFSTWTVLEIEEPVEPEPEPEPEPQPEPNGDGWMLYGGIAVVAVGVVVLLYLLRRRT
jgi:hypothetical protein